MVRSEGAKINVSNEGENTEGCIASCDQSAKRTNGCARRRRWLVEWRNAFSVGVASRTTKYAAATAVVAKAKSKEGEDFRISVRSLQAWWRAYTEPGRNGGMAGIEGLIDKNWTST